MKNSSSSQFITQNFLKINCQSGEQSGVPYLVKLGPWIKFDNDKTEFSFKYFKHLQTQSQSQSAAQFRKAGVWSGLKKRVFQSTLL